MEQEFRKQLKDASSWLLMMDHDSGYVEGAETSTSSSTECSLNHRPSREPEHFYLSEDALLERPDITFNFTNILPYEIDIEDHEERRKLFFSPEIIESSVPSQHSSAVYSGLENNESCSEASAEIAFEPPITVHSKTLAMSIDAEDNDVLTLTATESDMSLEQTFDPLIIDQSGLKCHYGNCNLMSPLRGFTRESPHPLSTVTNTFTTSRSTEKKKLTLVFSKFEKENGYSVKRKYPSLTPEKKLPDPVDSNISPDIFEEEMLGNNTPSYFQIPSLVPSQLEEKHIDKLDQKLLKRIQKGLSGVLPPPSVTIIHLTVNDILSKFNDNHQKYCFWNNGDNVSGKLEVSLNSSGDSGLFSKSLLLSVGLEETKEAKWPEVLKMRCHGLHYNCGKISEDIVDLCDKYQKRFVGSETQSTCTVFETQNLMSPSKRKLTRPKWGGKSPGRRLSHLARRRITFSSATLQAGGSSLVGSRARQILVDAKKIDLLNRRKSPRKNATRRTPNKTPSKSPKAKTRTPSSSAKKKLAMRFRKLTGEFENSRPSTSKTSSAHMALFKSPDKSTSTKRALFQSPSRDSNSSLFGSKSQDSFGSEERNQLRRALFTSPRKSKKSPFKQFGFEKKRKRSESDDCHPSKFQRSISVDVKPSTSIVNKSVSRTQSEMCVSLNRSQSQTELSEQHKKKLLWAVSGALQSQNITNTHPQWKTFASVLARVTRRFYASQMAASGAKPEGGTTERMHRIARYHVISVIKGKSVDEIISDYVKSRAKVQRPQGYVAPEGFLNGPIKAPSGGKENVFQDRANTIESWEKKKLDRLSKPMTADNKIERIRKVINFGDDR